MLYSLAPALLPIAKGLESESSFTGKRNRFCIILISCVDFFRPEGAAITSNICDSKTGIYKIGEECLALLLSHRFSFSVVSNTCLDLLFATMRSEKVQKTPKHKPLLPGPFPSHYFMIKSENILKDKSHKCTRWSVMLPFGILLRAVSTRAVQPYRHPFSPRREQQQRPAASLQEAWALRQLQGPGVAGKGCAWPRCVTQTAFAHHLLNCSGDIKPITE